MKSLAHTRSKDKLYRFHKDHGYDTEDCMQPKRAIERLIEQGHLKEYVSVRETMKERKREKGREITPEKTIDTSQKGVRGVINMIFERESSGRDSLIR